MSVAIHIKFKATDRGSLSIPVATQGTYHTVWLPTAKKLGLKWVPLFEDGPIVDVNDLAAVTNEFRKMREALASNPKNASILERIDFILQELDDVNLDEVSGIFIG
ncbi:hypothetical protein JRI60_21070 [Archangium violaceum]|uniref:hypothetical protein n=1 Tax=Archangium violaceum TaxID=83451 RepID=UPI0019517DF0|nr:hypothetical protein [Archangium violaceum]QRO01335.1 hypothetical protein JRI60_21070 [Archangium violaceum]